MGLLDEWGDALVEEGLREAADTFFGARRRLEEEITLFESRVAQLREQAREVRSWFAGLGCVLGGEANMRLFFDTIGVSITDTSLYALQVCSLQFKRPHSFTRRRLFTKTVWEVYEPLAYEVEKYMHGVHYTDAGHPGRVFVTVHYDQIVRHCAELNELIRKVNEYNRPSETLGFAKRMDQSMVRKEEITGGGGQVWALDDELAYPALDCAAYELPIFPELPTDGRTKDTVAQCCATIFERERAHVEAILDEVFSPADKKFCILQRTDA